MRLILVTPAKIEKDSPIKTVRCPSCKTGRLCDAITYKNAIKTMLFPSSSTDTVFILKCPHCGKLISLAVFEIEY